MGSIQRTELQDGNSPILFWEKARDRLATVEMTPETRTAVEAGLARVVPMPTEADLAALEEYRADLRASLDRNRGAFRRW